MFIVGYLGSVHKPRGEGKNSPSPRDSGGTAVHVSGMVAGKGLHRVEDQAQGQRLHTELWFFYPLAA